MSLYIFQIYTNDQCSFGFAFILVLCRWWVVHQDGQPL